MPVIACPDCGKDVSTLAPACPHCGRPSPAMTSPILPVTSTPMAKEETVWHGTPSWTLLIGRVIGLVTALIVIPTASYLLAAAASDIESRDLLRRLGWTLTTILVVILGISFVVGLIKLRSTRYTVTNQRVLIETGLLTKTVNEIDMRLIDDTLFFQGVLHRILGIGMVSVMSSDKNTPMYVLRGIPDPRGVREMIRTHSYHASQKQVFTRST
jgi:uncharacterized membrane protein YdbT with pleckstrin-like domain